MSRHSRGTALLFCWDTHQERFEHESHRWLHHDLEVWCAGYYGPVLWGARERRRATSWRARWGRWACRVTGHPWGRRTLTGWTGSAVRAVCGRCGLTGTLDANGHLQ